jgi:hypothetical protein
VLFVEEMLFIGNAIVGQAGNVLRILTFCVIALFCNIFNNNQNKQFFVSLFLARKKQQQS